MRVPKWVWTGLRKLRALPRTEYSFGDVQAHAATCKYTFFKPSQSLLNKVGVGDLVKVWFEYDAAPWNEYDAERMWVKITERNGDEFTGELDNIPVDMIGLRPGSTIHFRVENILSDNQGDPEGDPTEQFRPRCLVSQAILDGAPVDYLSRNKPLAKREGDHYPDSGWSLLAAGETAKSVLDNNQAQFVALGAVLNKDDRWLHLIDEPPGSCFEWNAAEQQFVQLESFDPNGD